mgnify:CR=1 FL=1
MIQGAGTSGLARSLSHMASLLSVSVLSRSRSSLINSRSSGDASRSARMTGSPLPGTSSSPLNEAFMASSSRAKFSVASSRALRGTPGGLVLEMSMYSPALLWM